MVAKDKTIEKGGENSYEFKIEKVLADMKAKPSIRTGKDWDLTKKSLKRRQGDNPRNDRERRNHRGPR